MECPPLKPIEGMMCTAQYDPVCGANGKRTKFMRGKRCCVKVMTKGECGVTLKPV